MSSEANLTGRTALITGGTSGVGLHTAREFATRGARVVITGRSAERGAQALRELSGVGGDVVFEPGDAGVYADVQRAVGRAAEIGGTIDILVSAGADGAVGPKPFREMSAEQIHDEVETLFYPRVYPVHAAIPHMSEGSCVVMLTTDAGRYPTSGESIVGAYAASITMLTKTLAKELSRSLIRVNAVSMTLTSDTRSWDRVFADGGFQTDLFTKAVSHFPRGRAPQAQEVAEAVVFLASDGASQITGQTLSVNGGLSFGGW